MEEGDYESDTARYEDYDDGQDIPFQGCKNSTACGDAGHAEYNCKHGGYHDDWLAGGHLHRCGGIGQQGVFCNDAAGVKPAIENADAEGVAMFTFDCSTDSEAINCFVGTDNYKGGQLGGQELLKYSEDGDTVGIICYPTASSCLDRQNGALDVLKDEDRTVVYDNDYQGDANKAQEIMENMLTANPDMAAVFCVGDPAATGALAAIKAAGSDCKIIGFDGNPEAKEAISDTEGNGKWWVSEIAQNPTLIGETIVEQMQKYLDEGKVDAAEIPIDPYVIDASNVADEM